MIDVLKSGKTAFQVGSNANLFDWTYVDNVVHAHILAAENMGTAVTPGAFIARLEPVSLTVPRRQLPTSRFRPEGPLREREMQLNPSFENAGSDMLLPAARNRFDQFHPNNEAVFSDGPESRVPVSGQAFFITNGEPLPFWTFARAVWAAYSAHEPRYTIALPPDVALAFAGIGEMAASTLGKKEPNLTRAKVTYSTTKRYYNIDKARRVLGYEPIVSVEEGIRRAVAAYKENESASTAADESKKQS